MDTASLGRLATEQVNERNRDLDLWSPLDIVTQMNQEDALVVKAVHTQLPQIAQAVEAIVERLANGGRLFLVGAGSSGRLGVLDASECPPTFGVLPSQVQGVIAGGARAIANSVEGAEDDARAGAADLLKRRLSARDAVVGIAASGRTPYVIGALRYARKCEATRIALVNALPSPIAAEAEIVIAPVTGPEIVSGSTRLKAGTAQKMVLNMLSTATFVRLGKVYRNLMVDVRASNVKLRQRAIRILCEASAMDEARARRLLPRVNWEIKTALVMHVAGVTAPEARRRLAAAGGFVRAALAESGHR
ncbi:MAG: N-acetylmuramic acid 6-phosphate etherase [Chloroflexi bacterium]|nr:N-acetylmuramic acid 6-phosphate etherase [Chloroflexota bacterium]